MPSDNALLDWVDRIVGWVSRVGLWMSSLVAIGIVLFVSLEVVMRTFFGSTLFVVEEFVGYLLAAFTMFGLAHTLRSDNILRVEIIYSRLSSEWQRRCTLLCHVVSLVFLVILEHQLIRLMQTSYRREIYSVTLMKFPVWFPQMFVAIGGAVLLITLANETLQLGLRSGWKRTAAEAAEDTGKQLDDVGC